MKINKLSKALSDAKARIKASQFFEAKLICIQIIEKFPLNADAHYLLVKINCELKQFDEAIESLKLAFESSLASNFDVDVAYDLQNVLIGERNFPLLESLSLWLTVVRPKDPYSWDYLSISRIELQRFQDALEPAHRAALLAPKNAKILGNLGAVFNGLKDFESARTYLARALEVEPGLANAHNNLGNALYGLGLNQLSIQHYLNAILLNPDVVYFFTNLAEVYAAEKQIEKAEEYFKKALDIDGANAVAFAGLIDTYTKGGRPQDAIALSERAASVCGDSSRVWAAYGNALQKASQVNRAVEVYIRALSLEMDQQSDFCRSVYSSLLFTLNYHPDFSAEVIYGAYEDFEKQFGAPVRKYWREFSNARDANKRLKIGYVAQAFYNQVCRYFLLPLMEHHDHEKFEVYAYSDPPVEDSVTEMYRSTTDHWIDTRDMSDEQMAAKIREDGIDVLIDIAGHSTDNRLGVFALKPAPVSLHWLDFGYTTGLKAIDYFIGDAYTFNDKCEHLFSEKIWRLPGAATLYRPPSVPDLTDSPFLKDGIVTFGSLSRANRINDKVIRVWSAILDAMPNSRLMINSGDFNDPKNQEDMASRFMAYGIERARLDIGFTSPSWIPLSKIDIGLDCFPHNSGTTLIESLYMGVPYVTLFGRPSVGRIGSGILHAAGHPEWIAYSELEYAQNLLALAHDTEKLVYLRHNLRAEIHASRLMDVPRFAREMEDGYRKMWQHFCEENPV